MRSSSIACTQLVQECQVRHRVESKTVSICSSRILILTILLSTCFAKELVAQGNQLVGRDQCRIIAKEFARMQSNILEMQSPSKPPYNFVSVEWYGPAGDGVTDDIQSFADAWADACSLESAVLYVPNMTYLVSSYNFSGPCGTGMTLQLAGTIVAPPDPRTWPKSKLNSWLQFSNLHDFTIEGEGTLDGRGENWWAQSCKINKRNPCHNAPTALFFGSVQNVTLRNIRSANSQQIHVFFSNSRGVRIDNIQITAPKSSPNTDGIHISHTENVLIQNSVVGTGDDCISIVSGSSNIRIKNVTCGPGHGISIGSLGKGNSEAYVSLVVVDGATLTSTTNGLRIKTWQGGSGAAIGFLFQNVHMINVSYPIIIDQFYCDSSTPCPVNQTSAVHVSEVVYRNIKGTSATVEAVKLACSDASPCQNVILADIELKYVYEGRDTVSTCLNVEGIALGAVSPPSCLQLSLPPPRAEGGAHRKIM